ncbi:MAG: glycosyltransferase family 9 protein [bacterium]
MRPRRLERRWKSLALRLAAGAIGPRGGSAPPSDVRRILVTKQHNQLGDFILATPLIASLARGYPGATIDYLANPLQHEAARLVPEVDRVFLLEGRGIAHRGPRLAPLVRALRARRYDLAICVVTVSYSTTSALLLALSGARFRLAGRIATSPSGPSLFHREVPVAEDAHETDRALAHLAGLGIEATTRVPRLIVPDDEWRAARRALAASGAAQSDAVVGVHPGAGKLPNRWPAPLFGELVRRLLRDTRVRVAIFAGPRETALVDAMGGEPDPRVLRMPQLSMRQLASHIRGLSLYVGNDTGTLHLAAALGVPTVGLFGPTDPAVWAPNTPRGVVLRATSTRIDDLSIDAVEACVRERLDAVAKVPAS